MHKQKPQNNTGRIVNGRTGRKIDGGIPYSLLNSHFHNSIGTSGFIYSIPCSLSVVMQFFLRLGTFSNTEDLIQNSTHKHICISYLSVNIQIELINICVKGADAGSTSSYVGNVILILFILDFIFELCTSILRANVYSKCRFSFYSRKIRPDLSV